MSPPCHPAGAEPRSQSLCPFPLSKGRDFRLIPARLIKIVLMSGAREDLQGVGVSGCEGDPCQTCWHCLEALRRARGFHICVACSRADFCGEDKARLCPAHSCHWRSEMFCSQQDSGVPSMGSVQSWDGVPPRPLPCALVVQGPLGHVLTCFK